jgi:hypothetical protein
MLEKIKKIHLIIAFCTLFLIFILWIGYHVHCIACPGEWVPKFKNGIFIVSNKLIPNNSYVFWNITLDVFNVQAPATNVTVKWVIFENNVEKEKNFTNFKRIGTLRGPEWYISYQSHKNSTNEIYLYVTCNENVSATDRLIFKYPYKQK